MRVRLLSSTLLLGLVVVGAVPAAASTCRDPAGFDAWLGQIKKEAIAQGISASAVESGLAGVQFDKSVYNRDHGQKVFKQSFEQFSQRMVPPRLARARALQKKYADIFQKIEAQYGVSSPILLAIWGLETDNGAVKATGYRVTQSVATLAYDCRRSEMFKSELFYALKMIQSGVSPNVRGQWAGEIGQTQFMPSTYVKYAVGGKDLNNNVYDVLASTANFLKQHGWKHGAGWAPGEPNFAAIQEWNKSSVYSRTIAYFATRLAGGSDAGYKDDAAPEPRSAEPKRVRARPADMDTDQMGGAGGGNEGGDPYDPPPSPGYRGDPQDGR